MQHRYVGDIGDFGKFGLINFLVRNGENKEALRLGVLWFLTHPREKEAQKKDGKHTNYLSETKGKVFSQYNPTLHQKLRQVLAKQRHLSEISNHEILPKDTIYWEEVAEDPYLPSTYRKLYRQAYLAQAAIAVRKAHLVFCDPDNGLGNFGSDASSNNSGKSIFLDELKMLWELKHSLLIYNHRPRQSEEILRGRYHQLKSHLKAEQITVFRYRKGTQRDFLLISQTKHRKTLEPRVREFQNTLWVKDGLFQSFEI